MEKLGGKGSDGNLNNIGAEGGSGVSLVGTEGCTGPIFYIARNSDGSFDYPNSGGGGMAGEVIIV